MTMSLEELSRLVEDQQSRQQIYDCLVRYASGVDRLDRQLVLSAFHPDAVDDHGKFVGAREEFVDWAFRQHASAQFVTQHCIFNHRCDLDGDQAHCETYYMFASMNRRGAPSGLNGGRYIDRFERRAGVWAIATRVCLRDWRLTDERLDPSDLSTFTGTPPPEHIRAFMNEGPAPARDRNDPSYQRPLKIDPDRLRRFRDLSAT